MRAGRTMRGLVRMCGVAVLLAAGTFAAQAAEPVAAGTASGLPVPRFVSLKTDKVNVRVGPAKDHEVAFVYNRSALPVEVIAESDNWRRIRDWEGAEGWVWHSLLSGRRTALVSPQTINMSREFSYDASNTIGSASQVEQIQKSLDDDMVQAIMFRLQAAGHAPAAASSVH